MKNLKNYMESSEIKITLEAALSLAFEAGRWMGQVDLEEHMDNEQFALACIESLTSSKICRPTKPASINREVSYCLRSQKWREGVRKSAKKYLEKAQEWISSGQND